LCNTSLTSLASTSKRILPVILMSQKLYTHTHTWLLQGLEPYRRTINLLPFGPLLAGISPVGHSQPSRISRDIIFPSDPGSSLRSRTRWSALQDLPDISWRGRASDMSRPLEPSRLNHAKSFRPATNGGF
jgi:hypothetical protein